MTISDLKRSHSCALSSDFLEVLQASILQDREAREQDQLDQKEARDRLDQKENPKAVMDTLTATAGGLAKAFMKQRTQLKSQNSQNEKEV